MSEALTIEPCSHQPHVARFASRASRERVSLKDTPATRWFRIGDMAVAGLLTLPNGRYRLRGAYVDAPFRGRGLGHALAEHRLALAESEGARVIEAYSLHPAWFLARGFTEAGRNAHGVVRVIKHRTA